MMLPLTLQVEIQGKFKPENKRTLTGAETWTVKEKKKACFERHTFCKSAFQNIQLSLSSSKVKLIL